MMRIRSILKNIQEYGIRQGLYISYSYGSELMLGFLGKYKNYGKNPFDEDWDILILLDACRYDMFLERVTDHKIYDKIESLKKRYSCASASREWMRKVYNNDIELSDIHLVSANGWEPTEVNLEEFGAVTPVWEHHDPEIGSISPEKVTDAAIYAGRHSECDRMIVHYIQPHAPFIKVAGKYESVSEKSGQGVTQNVWEGLRKGEYDFGDIWEDYGDNLNLVLDEVDRLIKNINGRVVISSDHANAVGELGIYGHPEYVPLPSIKSVPWVRLEAHDNMTSNPSDPIKPGVKNVEVEEHLSDLGYL